MTTSADAYAPALSIRGAIVAYGKVPVLEGIDGIVEAGDAVALIGPNGAGKSTLIKAILGLVPLVAGEITVLGRAPQDARRDVAYVPQADALDAEFPVSVLQVVLMGRYRRVGWVRRPGRADRAAAKAALERVGMGDRATARFGTLSGGQRQRVLIARAMAQESRLLLLDEPFSGVDLASHDLIVPVLDALKADGVAIVMSTHDLSLAHLTCEEACLLNRHQFAFGPIDEALTPDLLQRTYGGQATASELDKVIVARQ